MLQCGFIPNPERIVVPSIFNAAAPVGARSNFFFLSGVPEYKIKVFFEKDVKILTKLDFPTPAPPESPVICKCNGSKTF